MDSYKNGLLNQHKIFPQTVHLKTKIVKNLDRIDKNFVTQNCSESFDLSFQVQMNKLHSFLVISKKTQLHKVAQMCRRVSDWKSRVTS